jgi:3-phenylpropionate/trans-cinnamate dioxygenase ferredoxin subunit
MGYVNVATLDELPDGGSKQVVVNGDLVGLFRAGDDVYAISDVCTHEYAHLSEGEWEPEEFEVECPLHGSRFDVRDGSVRILPATRATATYEVKVEGNLILVGPKREANQGSDR